MLTKDFWLIFKLAIQYSESLDFNGNLEFDSVRRVRIFKLSCHFLKFFINQFDRIEQASTRINY